MRPSSLLALLCLPLLACGKEAPRPSAKDELPPTVEAPAPTRPGPTVQAPAAKLPTLPSHVRAVHVIGAGRRPLAVAVAPGPEGQRPAFASLDEDGRLRIAAGEPLELELPGRGVRLAAAASGPAFAVTLAERQGSLVWTPSGTKRIGAFAACAIEVVGGVTWVAGARSSAAPGEPDEHAELVLFPLGDAKLPEDEPTGVAQGVPEPTTCELAAAPDGRFAIAWRAGDGALRASVRDARGRQLEPPRTIATADEKTGEASIAWRRDGFVVGLVPKARNAPVVRPLAGGRELVLGPRFDGPAGDLSLRALPDGGLAAAWDRAFIGLASSPTELVVTELGPDDAVRVAPEAWLTPLAMTRGRAALLIDRGAVVAGGVAQVEGDRTGWFLTRR